MCGKVLHILPMATLALCASTTVTSSSHAANNSASIGEEIIALTENRQTNVAENGTSDQKTYHNTSGDTITVCEAPACRAIFPGGDQAVAEYISKNTHYPAKALENGVQGRVFVGFLVDEKGRVNTVGKIKAKAFTYTIKKKITREDGTDSLTNVTKTVRCDTNANSLTECVITSYMTDLKEQNEEMTTEEVEAFREGLDAIIKESERLIRKMPRWTPGYKDEKKKQPCITRILLPINFKLK